jgi:UDP-N-acetylmuramoyl-tripeptide--D-alanyl-D-alanine ligase
VIPLRLAEVAELAGGVVGGGDPDALVTAPAAVDSRAVEPGGLFVAVPGQRLDRHDFTGQALAAGVAACMVTRPVAGSHVLVDDAVAALGRLARAVVDRLVADGLLVVGVTGSSGKTSTKDLMAQLLASAGPTVAPEGSLNTEVGVPLTVLRATAGTRHLVLEMGARGLGHVAELCQVAPPRVGVVLNVGTAHAGEFGSRGSRPGPSPSRCRRCRPPARAGSPCSTPTTRWSPRWPR